MKKTQELSADRIIRRRRYDAETRAGYVSLIMRVIFLAIIVWVLLTKVLLITQVRGNDMFPAVKDGDLMIVYRLQSRYEKNDIAVYSVDGQRKLGRILGREGDNIMLDETGNLLVNGTNQAGEIMYPTYPKDTLSYPYTVPEDSFYLLNDYRTQGTDSRDYGAIPRSAVTGKLITILRRRGL